ncbi:MAG: hypothetical protein J7549_05055 [Variovorax sp.]|nr:hypothetical protein [Variovorax sp.]
MKSAVRSCLAVLAAAGGLSAVGPALAQTGSLPCDGVMQDRAACLRERGAAAQTARQGGFPKVDEAQLRQNALARCARQPPADQAACEQRVLGTGQTTFTGSVLGGGVIRMTETPVPAPSSSMAPMPAPSVTPMPATRPAPMPGQAPMPMPMPRPMPAPSQ